MSSSDLFYTIGGLLLIYGSSTIIVATLTDVIMDYFGDLAMKEFYRKKYERVNDIVKELSKEEKTELKE